MEYIMFILIGMIAGILLTATIAYEIINKLKDTINSSVDALELGEDIIMSQSEAITNLEANLEFVTNNLSARNKKDNRN